MKTEYHICSFAKLIGVQLQRVTRIVYFTYTTHIRRARRFISELIFSPEN